MALHGTMTSASAWAIHAKHKFANLLYILRRDVSQWPYASVQVCPTQHGLGWDVSESTKSHASWTSIRVPLPVQCSQPACTQPRLKTLDDDDDDDDEDRESD